MIQGSIVALVTPMHADGSLDMATFRALLDWHIAEGTDALCVVGTTGESPTVDFDEHCDLIRVAVKHVAGRVPVIAGTGANSTSEAIELTRFAREAGADASLSVAPYYNRPSQEGMYRHFRSIAEAVDLPMILYNVPGRTASDINNATILRLAEVPGIVGLKDATGDVGRGAVLLAELPEHFSLYGGDDATAVALMLLGARGNISVSANVAPAAMRSLCAAAMAGDVARAREWHFKTLLLHSRLFVEANPIPVKWALCEMGRIPSGIRLPLTSLSSEYQPAVREALRAAGVLA